MTADAVELFRDANKFTYSFRSTRSVFSSLNSLRHLGNPSRSLSSAFSTRSDLSLRTSSATETILLRLTSSSRSAASRKI